MKQVVDLSVKEVVGQVMRKLGLPPNLDQNAWNVKNDIMFLSRKKNEMLYPNHLVKKTTQSINISS